MNEGADGLIRILLTLKTRADAQGVSAQYTWDQISQLVQNIGGIALDYETFKVEYDHIPQLANIVDNFDANGITLNTKVKPAVHSGGEKGNGVESSAKRAAAKVMKR